MPVPKSVIKVKKDTVEYVSNVNRVEFTIQELSRAALKDVAKFLRNRVKQAAPENTGNLKKNIATWVKRNKGGELSMQIGVYGKDKAKSKGLRDPFYARYLELGTKKRPPINNGRGFLRVTVQDNIEEIRRIEGQYLEAIENENRAFGLIDEEEEIADD